MAWIIARCGWIEYLFVPFTRLLISLVHLDGGGMVGGLIKMDWSIIAGEREREWEKKPLINDAGEMINVDYKLRTLPSIFDTTALFPRDPEAIQFWKSSCNDPDDCYIAATWNSSDPVGPTLRWTSSYDPVNCPPHNFNRLEIERGKRKRKSIKNS